MNLDEALKNISGYENLDLYDNKAYLDEWEDWYKGKVETFHNYRIYNGRNYVPQQRFSLSMAKRVCEDWANLLINEKTDITLNSSTAQERLEKILDDCHFWRKANMGVEESFALGMGALVVSVDNVLTPSLARVKVTFVNATKIIPMTIEDGEIKEVAFINQNTGHTYISMHLRDEEGFYHIHNVSANGTGDNIYWTDDDYYVFDTGSREPWFAFIMPNVANNIDIDSPLGISIFANYIDILKEIDLIYDSMATEFALGKKRIFVNARMTSYLSKTGEIVDTFDSNDVVFYTLPEAEQENNVFIQSDTQALRVSEHETALQAQLNYLSYAVGFGSNHYKYNDGSVATATQVISENSEMFRNIKKHEILIEETLKTIVRAIITAANSFTTQKIICDPDKIEIKFDDSIIEDKESERASDRLDVSMGVMSKAEYRSKWYNEDLDTAVENIEKMTAETIFDGDEELIKEEEKAEQNGN